jgi:hypothetical protein
MLQVGATGIEEEEEEEEEEERRLIWNVSGYIPRTSCHRFAMFSARNHGDAFNGHADGPV